MSEESFTETSPLFAHEPSSKNTTRKVGVASAALCAMMLAAGGLGVFISKKSHSRGGNHSENDREFVSNLGIENISPYLWQLTASTASAASCAANAKPAPCYEALTNLAEQWVSINSTTESDGWIDLEYNVYDANDPKKYLGHIGVSISPDAVTISNQEGLSATIGPFINGVAQAINVTTSVSPPTPCQNVPPVTIPVSGVVPGVCFSGPEWGGTPIWPTCNDIYNAASQGFANIRLPFKLEYGSNNGQTIDASLPYVVQYLALAKNLSAAGFNVIVEPHNYMQFNGVNLTPEQCQSLIGESFIGLVKDIPNVMVELMNEPPGGFPLNTLAQCYQSAITAARAQNYKGPIIIEGATWGTPNAWTNQDGTPSPQFAALSQFFNGTSGDVQMGIHCYFNGAGGGGDGLSGCVSSDVVLAVNRIPELTALARANGIQIRITEIGVIQSTNCEQVLNVTLNHFSDNSDVYQQYNWWAYTPSNPSDWGPNGYPLLLSPPNDPRYLMLESYMPKNATENAQKTSQSVKANGRRNLLSARERGLEVSAKGYGVTVATVRDALINAGDAFVEGVNKGAVNAAATTITTNIVHDVLPSNNKAVVDAATLVANAGLMFWMSPETFASYCFFQGVNNLVSSFVAQNKTPSATLLPTLASTAISTVSSADPVGSLLRAGGSIVGGVVASRVADSAYSIAKIGLFAVKNTWNTFRGADTISNDEKLCQLPIPCGPQNV